MIHQLYTAFLPLPSPLAPLFETMTSERCGGGGGGETYQFFFDSLSSISTINDNFFPQKSKEKKWEPLLFFKHLGARKTGYYRKVLPTFFYAIPERKFVIFYRDT